MLADPYSWSDVERYYGSTAVIFKEEPKQVYIIDKVNAKYIYAMKGNEKVAIDITDGYVIDYTIPRKTIYQSGAVAHMISRIPAKQWKKGAHMQNTCFYQLVSNTWNSISFSLAEMQRFVDRDPYVKQEELTNSSFASFAISPRLSLSNRHNLFLDDNRIGTYDPITKHLTSFPVLFEYISSYLQIETFEDLYACA